MRLPPRRLLFPLLCCLLAPLLAAQEPESPAPDPAEATGEGSEPALPEVPGDADPEEEIVEGPPRQELPEEDPWWSGRLGLRYVHRSSTGPRRDQDLYQYLNLGVDREDADGFTASVYARGSWDLDGFGSSASGSSLSSLLDSNGRYDLRLFHAWVGFHDWIDDGEVRFGRQALFDTPVLLNLDGAHATFPLEALGTRWSWTAYAGVPEHFYVGSRSGDLAAGVAAQFLPWRGASARVDVLHLEDESFFGEAKNRLVGAQLVQRTEDGSAWATLGTTFLDDRHRDVSASGGWTSRDRRLHLHGFARALRSRQSSNTLEFDPFTVVLMQEVPYREGQLVVSFDADPEETVAVTPRFDFGVYARSLETPAQASEFNREFNRYWGTLTLDHLPVPDTWLSLTGEQYGSDDDAITTGGAEFGARPWEETEFTLSTGYSLYKFDFFAARERTRVRDVTLRARHRFHEDLRLVFSYAVERDDVETFQTGSLLLEVRF